MNHGHLVSMIEKAITWQSALQYSEVARRIAWQPEALSAQYLDHSTLLAFSPSLKVREIRNWITQAVGQNYALSAVFKANEPIVADFALPHLIRFAFMDRETALLFKITWI